MIAFMKGITSMYDVKLATTQIFYQFGALKIYKSKYVIPAPPEIEYKTAIQLATEDMIKQGINKTQAKLKAREHSNLQAFQEQFEQEKLKYKAQREAYFQKYKLHHPTPQGVLIGYLHEKYSDKKMSVVQYSKVINELPAQEKERVLKIVDEKYQKLYTEAQQLNEKFKETYQIPKVLTVRQIFARKNKILPSELAKEYAKLKQEEIQQLQEEQKLYIAETQKKIEKLAQTLGLSVEEFQKELKIAKAEFKKAKKQKKQSKSDSSSSSSDTEEKKEEKK